MRILWVVVDLTGPTEGDVVTVTETPETPTPGLAERLEAEEGHPDGGDITLGDLVRTIASDNGRATSPVTAMRQSAKLRAACAA